MLVKRGAEGVYCGLVRPDAASPTAIARAGFGFAVKIEDGGHRAAKVAAAAILKAALRPTGPVGERLAAYAAPPLRTAKGAEVGRMAPAGALQDALRALS